VRWVIADPRDRVFGAEQEFSDQREPPILSRDALDFIEASRVLEHLRDGSKLLSIDFTPRFHK
jgi:hypothetical protein